MSLKNVGSRAFYTAFLDAYNAARERHDETQWLAIWGTFPGWSQHMLWSESSVIRTTASLLGLAVARGERMRLDAVFVQNNPADINDRYPARVVLEHENAPGTFTNEIRLLCSVRAPLKVGITYALIDHKRNGWDVLTSIKNHVCEEHDRMTQTIGECSSTEYLYLVGEESAGAERQLRWRSLSFTAEQEPRSIDFN